MAGSILAQGDHSFQLWKSSMRGAIFSGVALMVTDRSTMKVEGFIAARMRIAAMATTARPPINLSINLPLWACLDVRTPAILPSRQLERGLCRELRVWRTRRWQE